MRRARATRLTLGILLAAILVSSRLTGQESKPAAAPKLPSAVSAKGKLATTAVKTKLTPQQLEALKILKTQAGVAKGLSPVMRTFALLEIARGMESVHDSRARAMLRDAFQASQTIENDEPGGESKRPLQGQIIGRLVVADPAYCEGLLSQVSGPARKSIIIELVKKYTKEKQFGRAVALLNELRDEEFPYVPASNLIEALPKEMAAERQNLFAAALSSYSQHEHKGTPGLGDFGVFLSRTWEGLAPSLVLQAIDEVLKQARESDAKMEITVRAAKGAASFGSTYEYALFQLLPILRELDPDRVDQLLQENRDLQSTLHHFPNGLKSLDPKSGAPDSITMHLAGSSESSADDRNQDELQRRANKIVGDATKDPKQALAAVMSLPDFHDARLRALLDLAATFSKAAPNYAQEALAESLKLIPSVNEELAQAGLLEDIAQAYLKLGDTASAQEVVDRGFKLAEKLYQTDTNGDDPNQAYKAEWPSTVTWKKFTALLARVSPAAALEIINNIPDPEIQALERIAVANGLLGTASGFEIIAVRTKSTSNYMTTMAEP